MAAAGLEANALISTIGTDEPNLAGEATVYRGSAPACANALRTAVVLTVRSSTSLTTDWSRNRVYGLSARILPSAGSCAICSAVGAAGGLISRKLDEASYSGSLTMTTYTAAASAPTINGTVTSLWRQILRAMRSRSTVSS